ncbi:hypothetical protein K490DRAFT_50541 [Saccharata proteae CBS 121410]|uniref:Uncharacterized protein n=1 Tax=Saccharata proteae CBS 121410 TaxID=1314787 RepID=A0A9P4LU84_9PEZI|nr:hypothetical protein K490DRAFT_50541 [Saccharata proteae CBS 121410]
MSAAQRILRIPRSDQPEAYIVLSIRSAGQHPLDLSLIATEGEHPFVAEIDHHRISDLRAANYHGSDAEWQAALSHALLEQQLVAGHDDARALAGLDTASAVTAGGGELAITLRKKISGITASDRPHRTNQQIQRLGTIRLAQRDEVEVPIFEWSALAATAAAAAQQQSRNLEAKLDAQQKTIDKLNAQLQDLTRAKQAHETALLQKFCEVLNGKKRKIRDQQRLLAGARVDPAAAAEIEHSRGAAGMLRARQPGPSRTAKRKANRRTPVAESESDLDADESRGQVDGEEQREGPDESRDVATPEETDLDETEDSDEDDESDGFDAAPVPRPAKSAVGAKGKAIEKAPLPPPRALPFSRRGNSGGAAAKAVETPTFARYGDGDETTDDDEL